MATTDTKPKFAAPIIAGLERAKAYASLDPVGAAIAMDEAIDFLRMRLSDAARDGCHHCDETQPAHICWWCGLSSGSQS